MAVTISSKVTIEGFDELLTGVDNFVESILDVYAVKAEKLMKQPTKFFSEEVKFDTKKSKGRRIVGTSNKKYIDVNNGFEHKTAFNKDFRPKTKPRSLVSFEGAGRSFPNRRREAVKTEPREFNIVSAVELCNDRSILDEAISVSKSRGFI